MTADPLAAKRAELAERMKARKRWDPMYEGDIARMPEPILDSLIAHYTQPIHVG